MTDWCIVAFREARSGEQSGEMHLCRMNGKVRTFADNDTARRYAGPLGVVSTMTQMCVDWLDRRPERAWNWVPKNGGSNA